MTAFAIWCVPIAALVLIWLLFRQGGYKRKPLDAPPAGPGWELTEERFIDPSTGESLEVWFNPHNGERAYVLSRSAADRR